MENSLLIPALPTLAATSLLPSLAATHKSVKVPPTSVPTMNPRDNAPPLSGIAEFAF